MSRRAGAAIAAALLSCAHAPRVSPVELDSDQASALREQLDRAVEAIVVMEPPEPASTICRAAAWAQ